MGDLPKVLPYDCQVGAIRGVYPLHMIGCIVTTTYIMLLGTKNVKKVIFG